MATTDEHLDHAGPVSASAPRIGRPRGEDGLAEIIDLRRARTQRSGLIGTLLVTIARVVASPRAQATPVRSTPHPPSSPDARFPTLPRVPYDAA